MQASIVNKNILLKATLSLPPGVNHSYKIVRVRTRLGMRHRLAATSRLTAFKQEARYCMAAAYKNWEGIKKTRVQKCPLSVRLALYYPDLRRRDIDSPIKAVIDAAFLYISLDDRLVVELHVSKYVDRAHPRCEISISLAEVPLNGQD